MKKIITTLFLTLVSIGLFGLLCAILPAISAFEPVGRAIDEIAITDIYYSAVKDRTPMENDRVLIVDTSESDRAEIAAALSRASRAGAAVVGIDILFTKVDTDTAGTRLLRQAVAENSDRCVAAIRLNSWDEASHSYVSTIATALDSSEVSRGYSNLINQSDNSFIRHYSVAGKGATPSFAQAVATRYLNAFGGDGDFSPTEEGLIDFTPQSFCSVEASDLHAIDSLASGRIVLLGALHADEDYHFTPVGPMSGVEIQAHSVNTLLDNPTVVAPRWAVWTLAFILVFISTWGFITIRTNFETRNPTANRYTYAALGLGNIVYPTFAVLLAIMLIGLIYLWTDCYIPPLAISGSLACIPLAHDLHTLIHGARTARRATAVATMLFLAIALPASAQQQTRTNIPTRTNQTSVKQVPKTEYDSLMMDLEFLSTKNLWESEWQIYNKDVCEAVLRLAYNDKMPYDNSHKTLLYEFLTKRYSIFFGLESAPALWDLELFPQAVTIYQNIVNDDLFINDFQYTLDPWYMLALSYYFGLGVETDYSKSYFCLEKLALLLNYLKELDDPKLHKFTHLYNDYTTPLYLLAYNLKAKGYPNTFAKENDNTGIEKYIGVMTRDDSALANCYRQLVYEDPNNLLDNFPNGQPKIEISAVNYMRFQPLIIKSKTNHAFLEEIAKSKDWRDILGLGLIYYYGDYSFAYINPIFNIHITNHGNIPYDHNKQLSLPYFNRAKELIKNARFKSQEEKDNALLFVESYIVLCTEGKKSEEYVRSKIIPALTQDFLDMGDKNIMPWFYPWQNGLLCEAGISSNRFTPIAKAVEGYLSHNTHWERNGKDDQVARWRLTDVVNSIPQNMKSKYSLPKGVEYDEKEVKRMALAAINNDTRYISKYNMRACDVIYAIALKEFNELPKPLPDCKFVHKLREQAHRMFQYHTLKGYDPPIYELKEEESYYVRANSSFYLKGYKHTPASTAIAKTAAENAQPIKFKFRTPNNSTFQKEEFTVQFTTNSQRATYQIIGQKERHPIPTSSLKAGHHTVTLPNRDCDLVIAYEDGQMETLHFVYDSERELRRQATLHLLCIGVNKYPAQNLNNLKYAEADAQAVADAFASRHKNTFANISKKVLVGSQVTRNQINAEIERIADDAKPNDLAIIFFAGHGMVDGLNKYYLATSEVEDVTVPRKGGLSANVFAEKISYIGCKLVVFIDACYSAKILESFRSGASNADFFKELNSTPNGTNIYTSSGANSLSREDDSLRHGAFTKALIESCDFNKADTDKDGRITITEVRNYLERRIPELTGNQQSPVHRNLEEISSNYPLFVQ